MILRISDTEHIVTGEKTLIMGILNVTPDSFSDGGAFMDEDAALRHAAEMLEAGADMIDVGGESTRPGYAPVDAGEELRRVLPVVRGLLREHPGLCVSVDTSKPEVAARCLDAGARIVNDISGLGAGAEMCRVLGEHKASCVLMHPRGADGNDTVHQYLSKLLDYAMENSGLAREHFILDPGVGFGKSCEENARLAMAAEELHSIGCPVLVGVSRKSFIGQITGRMVDDRLCGTVAVEALAAYYGADILRTHDVKAARDAASIGTALRKAKNTI